MILVVYLDYSVGHGIFYPGGAVFDFPQISLCERGLKYPKLKNLRKKRGAPLYLARVERQASFCYKLDTAVVHAANAFSW